MSKNAFFQQLGLNVAGITFGAALAIFIYAATSGKIQGASAWMLFAASFLLMLRFWWRYTTVFVQLAQSHTFLQFLLDFALAFFGILTVLFVQDIRSWALLGGITMLASILRCIVAKASGPAGKPVKRTIWGAVIWLIILAGVYFLAPSFAHTTLAGIVLALVVLFVLFTAKKA
jgi:hypothetical protein